MTNNTKRNFVETNICIAFMNRLKQYHPEIESLIYHIPNESKTAQRTDIGIKAGMPDYFLPVSRGGFGCLFLEIKKPKGRVSENQVKKIDELIAAGNKVTICYSWKEAVDECVEYWNYD
jgi:hypothetical protein